ncbi:hypothetical protein HBI56_180410 [Parastagonospora nodorum]|nr:hypothetical protein HBH52_226300 [Parastagonospora nodorum]KAH4015945.1 hypothetical protein HBI09_203930 [Parastagonospora nodorum]KAH4043527.1 hypothetical protein HBH49_231530 [Parastagonospora nodorum]KAH4089182.1 hypothetical protein HBH46_193640 [Parastagonospora nodorum]KAH4182133.1 hypothetical protein HBH42_225190 [Parastagonospora nodorum]
MRMCIVNSTHLIPLLQKQWRTVSFAAIAAGAGITVGISKEAVKIMHQDLTSEHGFSIGWPRYIIPAMSARKDLDAINRRSVEVLADEVEEPQAKGVVRLELSQWSRQMMFTATTEAVWGPQNPYRDPVVAEAWRCVQSRLSSWFVSTASRRTFEAGFLNFSMFPFSSVPFPKLRQAREAVAAAMMKYMGNGGHKTASGLVRMRFEHHHDQFGLRIEEIARGEL